MLLFFTPIWPHNVRFNFIKLAIDQKSGKNVCVVPVDSREERKEKEVPVAACCCVLFVSRQILNRWLCWFTKTVCWLADKREGLQRFSLPFTARCSLYRCCWLLLLMGGRNRNFVCWKVEMQFNWKWYRLKPNKTLFKITRWSAATFRIAWPQEMTRLIELVYLILRAFLIPIGTKLPNYQIKIRNDSRPAAAAAISNAHFSPVSPPGHKLRRSKTFVCCEKFVQFKFDWTKRHTSFASQTRIFYGDQFHSFSFNSSSQFSWKFGLAWEWVERKHTRTYYLPIRLVVK